MMHPCENYNTCQGWADGSDKLCQYCKEVEKQEKWKEANKWKWAGFEKDADNHRKGYRGQKP